jgi:hypothetical protein
MPQVLLSSGAAGIVIGRSGSNRAEIQGLSSARLQLSKPNGFFPGALPVAAAAAVPCCSVLKGRHCLWGPGDCCTGQSHAPAKGHV